MEALYRDKIEQHQAALAGIKQESVEESLAATTGHFSLEGEERRQTTAHTAAVKASGVGLEEHAEARRLGRLFDDWVAKRQDVDAVYAELGLATPREGVG